MKQIILTAVGFVMLGLGAVGTVLPLLPTTPFVLVAALCFAGNPALHSRIMKIPFVKEYIANYKAHNGVSRRTVAVSLIFLWAMLVISAFLIGKLWIILCLAAVGTAVTIHILVVRKPRKK